MHRTPAQLGPREHNPPRDRFDDPEFVYRVRYFATALRGAMLEVLDHFRPNADMEAAQSAITVSDDLIDILQEEPAGLVPERWLSQQRLICASAPEAARFVDVTDSAVLAELNQHPRVREVLSSELVRSTLGVAARLDEGTIRLVGPVGRAISQAVSHIVYSDDAHFAGITYQTRFQDGERCWAVFDDRVHVQFADLQALDITEREHIATLNEVARLYGLTLPINWR